MMAIPSPRLSFFSVVAAVLLLTSGCEQETTAQAGGQQFEENSLAQQAGPLLPDLDLAALDESPVSLVSYMGQPVVLNLWATWCPPCRREMPVFEQAQADFPDIAFVMLNQGESAQQAQDFLQTEGLALTDVLLDPSSQAMRELKTGGLPTTFYFDARGELVDLHLGELTMAEMKDTLSQHY